MPFKFKRKESVAKALRRITAERIADARANFKDGARLESVHNVRKEIKKLRALLRLVRREIGRNRFRKNNRSLRKAAECLTGMRDAHVRLNAFTDLTRTPSLPPRPFPGIEAALRRDCREEERKFLKRNSASEVERILRKLKRRAVDLETDSKGWSALGPGFRISYRRAQQTLATARQESSPENLHEWRKRVKDLWYDLRLLSCLAPQELRPVADQLEQLGEFLGEDHDLVMLEEFVRAGTFSAAEIKGLQALIRPRHHELRSNAMSLGNRLFRESAQSCCARMGHYWKSWRKGK